MWGFRLESVKIKKKKQQKEIIVFAHQTQKVIKKKKETRKQGEGKRKTTVFTRAGGVCTVASHTL